MKTDNWFEGYDGIRACAQCGNDATGELCTSCATQRMIDNDTNPPRGIENCKCAQCGTCTHGYVPFEHDRYLKAGEYLILCPSCHYAWEINGSPLKNVFEWVWNTFDPQSCDETASKVQAENTDSEGNHDA
jgi:hypothetical protein